MLDFLRKLSRWDQSLLLLLTVYLLLWPIEPVSRVALGVRVILQIAIYVTGTVVLTRYAVRGARQLIQRFLWRVRHRMAAVFFFVGFIPLMLAMTLAVLAASLLFGPFAAFMVTAGIEQHAASLQAQAASLGWQVRATPPPQRQETVNRFLENTATTFPGVMARIETSVGAMTYPPGAKGRIPSTNLPNYQGTVLHEGQVYLAAHSGYVANSPSVLLVVPLTVEYLAELIPGLGPVVAGPGYRTARVGLAPAPPEAPPPVDPPARITSNGVSPQVRGAPTEEAQRPPAIGELRASVPESPSPPPGPEGLDSFRTEEQRMIMRYLPPPTHPFDYRIGWPVQVPVMSWADGEEMVGTAFVLYTRPSAVARLLLTNQSQEVSNFVRLISFVLMGLFGGAIVVSVVVAVSLTRTLTRSIHDLYEGTQRVNVGDFSHRVPILGNDQLTVLARSFNTMTASIERLIEESRERERLQSELDIAREVQAQLFPRSVPNLKSLDMLGVCRPAQSVSGDFFDYVQLSDSRVALTLGDVSGKGISAALVMAALHSILRTQLSLLATARDGEWEAGFSTAEVVAKSNLQLHAGTSSEKFATLFFSAYDEKNSSLVYTNAGHLPPLLIRKQEVIPLEVSGLVVGAFPHARYESSIIELQAGDLLVAFTDGVTEPENAYGEEFGTDRLKEILLRESDRPLPDLIENIMQQVIDWTGDPSLQDDMTMLVARRR